MAVFRQFNPRVGRGKTRKFTSDAPRHIPAANHVLGSRNQAVANAVSRYGEKKHPVYCIDLAGRLARIRKLKSGNAIVRFGSYRRRETCRWQAMSLLETRRTFLELIGSNSN